MIGHILNKAIRPILEIMKWIKALKKCTIWRIHSNRQKSCGDVRDEGLITQPWLQGNTPMSFAHNIPVAYSSQTYWIKCILVSLKF